MPANSRRRFFVDRLIQGRIVGRLALYWVFYHVVLWHTLFVYRYVQYRGETLAGATPVPFGELYGQFVIDYYPIAVFALATLPIFLFDIIRLTHAVAGPIVRFRHVMQALLEGQQVPPVKLRRGDLLLPFQDTFNEFTREFVRLREQGAAAAPTTSASAEIPADDAAPIEPAPACPPERMTEDQAHLVEWIVETPAEAAKTSEPATLSGS